MPRLRVAAVTATLLLALTACTGGTHMVPARSQAAPATTSDTAQAPEQAAPDPTPMPTTAPPPSNGPLMSSATPSPACSSMSGSQALATWVEEVPKGGDEFLQWDIAGADTSTYDPCAALSWIVLGMQTDTGPMPWYQIMLFHRGEYLGTTASGAIMYYPVAWRLSDSMIQVTYTWTSGSDYDAVDGQSVSYFTWDEAAGHVVHTGEWPPGIG